jgi:hypothetical protein
VYDLFVKKNWNTYSCTSTVTRTHVTSKARFYYFLIFTKRFECQAPKTAFTLKLLWCNFKLIDIIHFLKFANVIKWAYVDVGQYYTCKKNRTLTWKSGYLLQFYEIFLLINSSKIGTAVRFFKSLENFMFPSFSSLFYYTVATAISSMVALNIKHSHQKYTSFMKIFIL